MLAAQDDKLRDATRVMKKEEKEGVGIDSRLTSPLPRRREGSMLASRAAMRVLHCLISTHVEIPFTRTHSPVPSSPIYTPSYSTLFSSRFLAELFPKRYSTVLRCLCLQSSVATQRPTVFLVTVLCMIVECDDTPVNLRLESRNPRVRLSLSCVVTFPHL